MATPSSAEGNNGTVKIDGWTLDHGNHSGAPNSNEPHLDCDFTIEWYNYDASVTSSVTFEMWEPTGDVGLSGTEPASVALDGDDATGANAAGLDATQYYKLSFDGEPAEHGYHVKLTVNTPISNGADVKHKVFWVEGCEEPTVIPLPEPTSSDDCDVEASWDEQEPVEGVEWSLAENGDLIATITAENTTFPDGSTMHNFGQPEETVPGPCEEEPTVIPLPEPTSSDACGVAATWDEQEPVEGVEWSLADNGDLIATITAANTTFPGGETSHNFGQPFEEFPEECEVGGVQLEVPAEPKMKDPCDPNNASWVVPADTAELDWMLDGETGELSVEILTPDTTFEGTQDTTFNFGVAEETNKKACEVKGEEEEEPDDKTPTVEVKGEQAVPAAVNAGLTTPLAPQGAPRGLGLMLLGAGLALLAMSVPHRRRTATRR